MAYGKIHTILYNEITEFQIILYPYLQMKKKSFRWIAHRLRVDQQKARADWRLENLERYHKGEPEAMYNISIRDET